MEMTWDLKPFKYCSTYPVFSKETGSLRVKNFHSLTLFIYFLLSVYSSCLSKSHLRNSRVDVHSIERNYSKHSITCFLLNSNSTRLLLNNENFTTDGTCPNRVRNRGQVLWVPMDNCSLFFRKDSMYFSKSVKFQELVQWKRANPKFSFLRKTQTCKTTLIHLPERFNSRK